MCSPASLYLFAHIFTSLQASFDTQHSIFLPSKFFFSIGYSVAIESRVCPDYTRSVFENKYIFLSISFQSEPNSFHLSFKVIVAANVKQCCQTHIWFPCISDLRTSNSSVVDLGLVPVCLALLWFLSIVSYCFLCVLFTFFSSLTYLSSGFHFPHFLQPGFHRVFSVCLRIWLSYPFYFSNLELQSLGQVILAPSFSDLLCCDFP